MVPKLLGFAEMFCFASPPHSVSVGGVMKYANVRYQANIRLHVTLQALSNEDLLIL